MVDAAVFLVEVVVVHAVGQVGRAVVGVVVRAEVVEFTWFDGQVGA